MSRTMTVAQKKWPLHKPFKISRGKHTHAETVLCTITEGEHTGRGEAAGVSYDGETMDSIQQQVRSVAAQIEEGVNRDDLQELLPPGGARNVIDCALWDLEAKQAGKTIWELIGWEPQPVTTVYTVGIDKPRRMRKDAAAHADYPFLKVKVGLGDPFK